MTSAAAAYRRRRSSPRPRRCAACREADARIDLDRARAAAETRTPPCPAPGFASEKSRIERTNGPGANGPSTVTRIGTAKPLSASRGRSRRTRSSRGVRPAKKASSAPESPAARAGARAPGRQRDDRERAGARAITPACALGERARGVAAASLIAASRDTRPRPRLPARSGSACPRTRRDARETVDLVVARHRARRIDAQVVGDAQAELRGAQARAHAASDGPTSPAKRTAGSGTAWHSTQFAASRATMSARPRAASPASPQAARGCRRRRRGTTRALLDPSAAPAERTPSTPMPAPRWNRSAMRSGSNRASLASRDRPSCLRRAPPSGCAAAACASVCRSPRESRSSPRARRRRSSARRRRPRSRSVGTITVSTFGISARRRIG